LPIVDALDETPERVVAQRLPDEDFYLVPIFGKSEIHSRKIGGVTDP
jgi:hypothetical protein